MELQLVAIGIVASRMKNKLEGWQAADVDIAAKAAKNVTGVWPKAEFLASLSTSDLLYMAIGEFCRLDGVSIQQPSQAAA